MADKTVVVRLALKSGQFTAGLAQAGAATNKFASEVAQGANKASSASLALGTASAAAGKLMILGVGGALAVSAKAAIDFESSMASVSKTTDLAGNSFDENSGPLFRFGEALRGLALRTPINVNELAEIAALGGQLGVEVPNLIEFTEVMAALGVTTNMSATEAAKGFARFANIMRTSEQDFDVLGSIVVELGNNFATTESEILTFATRLAPVGVVAGMTEDQVFGLSAALTSLGVPAERGGTALQRVFISMKQAVDSGSETLGDFAEVAGTTREEFQDLFRESPAKAFAAFVKGLDRVSKAGGDVFQVLDRLNLEEQRTIQVLLATASGYQVVEDAVDSAAQAGEENIALFEEARKRYGTTASQLTILGNAFNDLRIEIGNAVLGSGGITFAVDAMSEFMSIVKDNLPILGRLAQAFVIIGAIRMGANLFELGSRAVDAVRGLDAVAKAASGMSTATRFAQGGILLLNTAMSGVLAIGTLVLGLWAMQAIKAAELRIEVRKLNDAIAAGGEPSQVLADNLRETGKLTPELEEGIQDLGMSAEDFARRVLEGDAALNRFGISGNVKTARQEYELLVAQSGEHNKSVLDYIRLLEQAGPLVEEFFTVRRNELVGAILEANVATGLSVDTLRGLADTAIDVFGLDITETEFVRFVSGQMPMDGWLVRFSGGVDQAEGEIGSLEQTWMQYMRNIEGGDEMIEDFWEDSIESVENFRQHMIDSFEAVDESVRDGFPAWDEYETIAVGAMDGIGTAVANDLDKVIDAQDRFIEDITAFANKLPLIMGTATEDTLAFIESLGPGLQGALGRLSDDQLVAFVESVNSNFEEIAEVTRQTWLVKMPTAAREGTAQMVMAVADKVAEFGLPGELAGQAFSERLMQELAQIPEDHRDEAIGYIAELLGNTEFLEGIGLGAGEDWIAGLLLALQGMATRVNAQLARQAAQIKKANQLLWLNTSPSKWWKGFGLDWMAGLQQGIEEGARGVTGILTPAAILPPAMAGISAGSSVTNNRNRNQTINLNFTPAAQGTVAETQTALTLLGLVGGVETGSGRWN